MTKNIIINTGVASSEINLFSILLIFGLLYFKKVEITPYIGKTRITKPAKRIPIPIV